MKVNVKALLITSVVLLVGVASAQQVNSSSNASVSTSTSVSADKSGANVDSKNDVNASSQTGVTAPALNSDKGSSNKEDKAGSASATSSLASGTTVNAVLSNSLDSRKLKAGDQVTAKVAEDVKSNGKVVVRKGSKLVGHVTEAKAKGEGEANSSLGVVFDYAELKDGQKVQLNSVVQAIGATQANLASSMNDDSLADVSGGARMVNTGAVSGGSGGGGLLGGVGSTVGSTVHTTTGAVANVGGGAGGALNSTLGSTANAGNTLNGTLNSKSSGVVGLQGLSLATDATNATQGSVITSTGKSVKLDSGTQMVLRVVK